MEIQNSDDRKQPNVHTPGNRLQTRLASLEQENTLLRSQLAACEQSRESSLPESNCSEHCLLEATAKATNALLTIAPFAQAVNTALQILGESLECDRIHVIEFFSHPSNPLFHWQVSYSWNLSDALICPNGIEVIHEEIEEWYKQLEQGQSIFLGIPKSFRSEQADIGMSSLHIVPIFVEGKLWGSIGFDSCREVKQRSAAKLSVLRIAADCIGSAIQRERDQQALLQAEQARLANLEQATNQAAIAREQEKMAQARVAELEQINTQFQRSQQRLQDLINTMSDWAWEVDVNGAYTFVDEKVSRLLGYSPDEMLGKTPFDFMPNDESSRVFASFSNIMAEHKPFSRLENRNLAKDGHEVIFETSGTPMFDLEGNFSGYRGADCNVTELRQAQEALLRAEQERTAELAKANDVLRRSLDHLANDRDLHSFLGHILKAALQMLDGIDAQIFLYDAATDQLAPSIGVSNGIQLPAPGLVHDLPTINQPFPANITPAWARMVKQRSPIYFDLEQDAEDHWPGTVEWHRSQGHTGSICVALILGNEPLGILGLAVKRSQFSQSEFEFFQALAQQATLAIQLTRLAEEAKQAAILDERNRMAREIHDTLAQALGGIVMQLQASDRFFTSNPAKAQHHQAIAHQLAQDGLDEARRTVWLLYQDDLKYRDLATLIPKVVNHLLANTDLQFEVAIVGTPYEVEPNIGINLLRITQESINNALRHAHAQTIRIHLTYTPHHIRLCIRDDGCGFNPEQRFQGFGLTGMQQRTQAINAQFHLNSHPATGTEVCIVLPSPSS
jgi:PAS domain S-box-containing protein